MTTRFFVQQKITVLTNRYEVCEPLASGENGPVMAFAEQAKMKIREKITFFRDSTKAETLFSLRAEKVLDIHGKYFVEDASGALVGGFLFGVGNGWNQDEMENHGTAFSTRHKLVRERIDEVRRLHGEALVGGRQFDAQLSDRFELLIGLRLRRCQARLQGNAAFAGRGDGAGRTSL